MTLGPSNLSFLPISGFPPGQMALLNYVHTMGSFDVSPFCRSAFSPMNLSERMALEISEGRRTSIDGMFMSAASLVARTVKQERVLREVLGDVWRQESRFIPAVEGELAQLRKVIGASRTELKAWRVALHGFRFDGIANATEVFDLSEEEPLGSLLHELQLSFVHRISDAREILEDYGDRSLAGIEAYFSVSRQRVSGPVAKVSPEMIEGIGKLRG